LKRKKIAIIISSPFYIRNYLLTNAFSEIEKSNNIFLIVPYSLKSIQRDYRFNKYEILIYKYPKFLNELARFINELSLFKSVGICKDFAYRIKRKYNHSPHLNDGTLNARRIDQRIKVFLLKNFYVFIARQGLIKLINPIITKIFSIYSPVQKCLKSLKADVLICPCSAAGTEEFDLGAYSSKSSNKTKLILIVDNWDNLSSKYVMTHLPTHTVVWGNQTKFHGITIQGIEPNKISALGTPRFYCYSKEFQLKHDLNKSLPDLPDKYILFLGSQTYFDENIVLKKLVKLTKKELNGFRIVYRPHPWRETFNKKIKNVKGVILDPTLEKKAEAYGDILLPSLDLYNHIISNSSLVVGGCTSMIVETALMRKPYLLLAHDDGNPIQSPLEYYKKNEHQNLTAILNNVSVCYSLEDLLDKVKLLLSLDIEKNDPVLDYIISPKYLNFAINLKKLID